LQKLDDYRKVDAIFNIWIMEKRINLKHRTSIFKKLIFILCLFLCYNSIIAQTEKPEPISPDRPGYGTPPSLVLKNAFQIESGFQYERAKDGNVINENYSYNQLLLRYGLFKFAEIRAASGILKTVTQNGTSSEKVDGMMAVSIGTKIKLYEGKGIIPATSLLIQANLPYFSKKEFRPDHIAPSVLFLFQNSLTEKLSLGYNLGLAWNGTDNDPSKFYAVTFGYNISDKVSCFIENYGNFYGSSSVLAIDGGFAFLVLNNLQLDISGGPQVSGEGKYGQISFGIAWRIPR
jgi:hypothetical protein